MNDPQGHENRSTVHQRAMIAGARINRREHVDLQTTLIEYVGARGCYAYFGSVRGSYHMPLTIDLAKKIWPDEEIPMPMSRVGVIMMS